MDQELKAKWVKALRSGEYQQLTPGGKHWRRDGKHCCLGVLGELLGEQEAMDNDSFGRKANDAGLSLGVRCKLVDMNDEQRSSFAEIADYIEKEIPCS